MKQFFPILLIAATSAVILSQPRSFASLSPASLTPASQTPGTISPAKNPTIEILSFQRVGDVNSQVAEICGVVKDNLGEQVNLTVIADYNSKDKGEYHTFAGRNGNFCQLIRTFYGQAEVVFMNEKKVATVTENGKSK
jgi:hypothetical protein